MFPAFLLMGAVEGFAYDRPMHQPGARIQPSSIPRIVSSAACEISTLWVFVLAATAILLGGLLVFSLTRFRVHGSSLESE